MGHLENKIFSCTLSGVGRFSEKLCGVCRNIYSILVRDFLKVLHMYYNTHR